ncbi:tyrosine-type recombinase/integrase [Halomonas elongata]|uniref:Integrase family protein n=1 Tax=Halomonas elongata (strain ATCC 33173 / DSM 2581 / NBRC 15536 / NCIMB 2198 / 1H9) TaxID=768066 RepID=E1VAN0_HALED|nr:site-specific integrase [Halomonas elongata]WBF17734.1 tyrosine-type recombinase/integrase [Halomonas elongata]WPU46578.1 site-specific integrase [Halomonas elongata DSM 2581]CBV43979.2 integrase family protein [Halomonas elongata DSM 2581]
MNKDLNNLTFPELLTEYCFEKWLAPKTQQSYAGPVRRLRHYFGEDAYPGDISRRMVNRWRSAILSSPQNPNGIAATSWNNYARHLRALYNFGIEREYIPLEKNPFHGVAVRELQRRHKTLNASDIARAREALELCRRYEVIKHEPSPLHPAWFWSVVVEMFYHTGIRLNQLLTIQGRDIKLRQRTFVASADGAKNGRETTLPITEALYPHLLTLMRSASVAGFTRGDQLFNVNRFSERHRRDVMDTWQVERFFNRLSHYSGGRITPHRFRHTLATDLMRSPGRDLHLTQAVCGHTDIRSTLGYVHNDIDTLRKYLEQRGA